MQIALLHDSVSTADAPDAQDVLVQADAVTAALEQLGHRCSRYGCGLNLEAALQELHSRQAELVFNLVESLAGQGRLIHLLPACLEAEDLPFTGSCALALLLSSNKLLAKERLQQAGIATPAWITPQSNAAVFCQNGKGKEPWIIKSVWEHASIGMDGGSVQYPASLAALQAGLRERAKTPGGPFFAEAFIDGREFNLSLLADTGAEGGAEVLPAAEIVFDDFPAHMPRIVDYAAKWQEDSFAYSHTRRVFPGCSGEQDAALISRLQAIARQCWQALNLRGYARVDFRVDEAGKPWVLEVNTNPCLAPDAGFAVALEQAGIAFPQAIKRIVQAALAERH